MEYQSYKKTLYGVKWQLIFYHYKSSLFNKGEELFINTGDKFSILQTLDESSRIRGYFEFLLEYPNDISIHWKQKTNPLSTSSDTSDVGFKPIKIDPLCSLFEGLSKSSDSFTFLDGTPGSTTKNWWYSIGCYTYYDENTIPGPPIPLGNDKYSGVDWVYLWRCVGYQFQFTPKNFCNLRMIQIFVFITIIC